MRQVIFTCFFVSLSILAVSQATTPVDSARAKFDSVRRANAPRTGIRPFEELINDNFSMYKGLFSVYQRKDTVYFEIPDSILHRDIEVINRLVRGPGGTNTFAGEELDEKTIQFEKHMGDSTIRILYDLVISSADSTSNIFKVVEKANTNPVVVAFPIKAFGKDSMSYIIDMTQFFKQGPSFIYSIEGSGLSKFMDGRVLKDFYIESIHAYPINVEMSISRNGILKGAPGTPPGSPATLETHTSFIELPLVPMQQRIADPRVGYFADQVFHYTDDQQKVEDRKFILRWKLEPRDEDIAKWKKGELVEPKKPIVIYIDPATPKQWRKYLILGIDDWQKAFEQAGFKNAIRGSEWPEGDTSMHMDDARYNFVNYLPSDIWNAYGPNVHDPRSGEIIQTHIGWYHNVLQLLHEWYMIQAGATDPRARHAKFDDELMGQLIRFVSSHEVGHTLGLAHNWGASSQTPVDSLRSKHYLDYHGHTSSIMDYARFNYVAQPEDNIPEYDLFPRIGEYDDWAIEWGYKNSGASTTEEDKILMRKLATDSLSKNSRLLWLGEQGSKDPRIQKEDLSDNAAKAGMYGIKNLRRILPNLPEWTKEEGGEYENLALSYKMLKNQYFMYMNHALRNIGGVWTTLHSEDVKGDVYAPVPMKLQKEVLAFFDKELFTTPYWIMDKKVTQKISEPVEPNFVEDLQVKVLNTLLDIGKMNQILAGMLQFGDKALPLTLYLATIHQSIWRELGASKAIDPYRRNLQKSYVGAIQDILTSNKPEETETDAYSLTRTDFKKLLKELQVAIPKQNDPLSREHLEDLEVRVKNTLEAKRMMQ